VLGLWVSQYGTTAALETAVGKAIRFVHENLWKAIEKFNLSEIADQWSAAVASTGTLDPSVEFLCRKPELKLGKEEKYFHAFGLGTWPSSSDED